MAARVKIPGEFFCPLCGKLLYSCEKNVAEKCSHMVFTHYWGHENSFAFIREDYAKQLVVQIKASDEYKKEMEGDIDFEPIDAESEEKLISGNFEALDEISLKFGKYGYFTEILPEGTVIFCDDRMHSGVHIGIDFGV